MTMPVRKLSTLPADDDSLWLDPTDPQLIPTIVAVWERSHRLYRPYFPPGVYKHASIEDANRTAERWEHETIERACVWAGRPLAVPKSIAEVHAASRPLKVKKTRA
jgi:hypothetical protein